MFSTNIMHMLQKRLSALSTPQIIRRCASLLSRACAIILVSAFLPDQARAQMTAVSAPTATFTCAARSATYRLPFPNHGFGHSASADITELGITHASQILVASSHIELPGEQAGRVDTGPIMGSDVRCDNLDISVGVTDDGEDGLYLYCDDNTDFGDALFAVVRITYAPCGGS